MLPRFPRPPRPRLPPNPIKPLKELIRDVNDQIHKVDDDIRSLDDELHGGEAQKPGLPAQRNSGGIAAPPGVAQESGTGTTSDEGTVSEETTFKYQLDQILDDLQHLETEHLPAKGRIAGLPCDCIAKASRDLRRHSLETIPIASRQGKDASIFSEMVPLANEMMEIGTMAAVKSGQHDADYLRLAGIVSDYRKKISQILSECKECSEFQQLMDYIKEKRSRQSPTGPETATPK